MVAAVPALTCSCLTLRVPALHGLKILRFTDAALIEEPSKDDLAADMELRGDCFRRCFVGLSTSHRPCESVLRSEELRRKAVAENFDLLGIASQAFDVAVPHFVDAARVKDVYTARNRATMSAPLDLLAAPLQARTS